MRELVLKMFCVLGDLIKYFIRNNLNIESINNILRYLLRHISLKFINVFFIQQFV